MVRTIEVNDKAAKALYEICELAQDVVYRNANEKGYDPQNAAGGLFAWGEFFKGKVEGDGVSGTPYSPEFKELMEMLGKKFGTASFA